MSKHWSKACVFTKTFQGSQIPWIFKNKFNYTFYKNGYSKILGYLEHIFKQINLIINQK